MNQFGDIYYEGKENDIRSKNFKPGKLSDNLRAALGITELAPPPWLINMQRYGAPPSYPNLKIPGINQPILEGILHYSKIDGSKNVFELNAYGSQLNNDIKDE